MPRILNPLLLAMAGIAVAFAVPILYLTAAGSVRTARSAVADACAAELSAAHTADAAETAILTAQLEDRYGLREVAVVQQAGKRSAEREFRTVAGKTYVIEFRPGREPATLPLVRIAVVIAVAGSFGSMVLLVWNLMTAMRPAAQGAALDGGGDGNLFRTFQRSIQTLKRESEKEHERAEELAAVTATLVRSLSSGFIAVDEDGLIVDVNSTGRELLGIPADTIVMRRSIAEILGHNEFSDALQSAVAKRQSLQRVEIGAQGDPGFCLGLTTVPLLDVRDRYLGMLALFTDLAPFRKLENRLREMHALADLGEISAGIAHEFRNSLSTVLGYLRLATRAELPPEVMERLQRAEREALQLNSAVESLLAYARPMHLQMAPTDLLALVGDLIQSAAPLAPHVRFSVDGERAVILADAPLLLRAFENVVRNSVEAIGERPGSGTIVIHVERNPAPRVTISDDGVGIRSEDVPRLFLPFQSNKAKGSGLGLALTKKIVILHGGTITLDGHPGQGAVATLEFASAEMPAS
jgi:signal transduction histidine kinase